jgi:hypothetical protein
MLKISATKVAHAIARAREHDVVAGSWESLMQKAFQEDMGNSILDSYENAAARGALAEFVDTLDKDEQASLLAIAWVGRGAFPPENLAEAFEKAKSAQLLGEGNYLAGIPLLADYLHEGLERLGLLVADRDESPNWQ